MGIIVKRKLITAFISSSIYAILLSFVQPSKQDLVIERSYLLEVLLSIPYYLLYSFPLIVLYGGLTLLVSESMREFIASILKKEDKKRIARFFHYLSASFLTLVVIIFKIQGIAGIILFHVTEKILHKKKQGNRLRHVLLCLIIPILVFLIPIGLMRLLL